MSPGPLANVLAAFDPPPLDVLSDYVSTEFTLDMVLTSLALRPPLLRGARLRPDDGLLEPDEANPDVVFWLPRLKLRLQQNPAGVLTLDLLSVGSSGLDDAGDLGVAEMIRMEPPYAFIGDSRVVGFGFRRAVLDLSEQSTPPEVLEQFGYDESWKGLYLPEIRLFVAPHGMRDLAVDRQGRRGRAQDGGGDQAHDAGSGCGAALGRAVVRAGVDVAGERQDGDGAWQGLCICCGSDDGPNRVVLALVGQDTL